MHARIVLSGLLAGLALAGCSMDVTIGDPDPSTPLVDPTPAQPVGSSWDGSAAPVDLGDGFTLAHCEGSGPFLCVSRGDRHVGVVELLSYPAGDRPMTLEERVADFIESMRQDRFEGCGAGYRFEPIEAREVGLGGIAAFAYGFDGFDAEGVAVDRVRGWMAERDGTIWVVAANAYAPDGCLGNEGGEFVPADLEAVEGPLTSAILATPLP